MRPSTEERFWANVDVREAGECWEWKASRNRWGYGKFRAEGRYIGAHRYSAMLHLPTWDSSLHALHHCDNPACVNPAHLYMGTDADNSRDRTERGRARNQHVDASHCKHGHEFTPENTYVTPRGHRECRACTKARVEAARANPERQAQRLAYWREYRAKQKAGA